MLPALRELRALGLQLVVVSNANGTVQALAERLGSPSASAACSTRSSRRSIARSRFFEIALERSGATRDATIHVGDLYEVMWSAPARGITPGCSTPPGLYPDADCVRVRSLRELTLLLTTNPTPNLPKGLKPETRVRSPSCGVFERDGPVEDKAAAGGVTVTQK